MLATVPLAGGDYTKAADTSGRKVTIAAKANVSVLSSGNANWICINDTVNSLLKSKTTCTAQALNSGGLVNIPSYVIHVPEPT